MWRRLTIHSVLCVYPLYPSQRHESTDKPFVSGDDQPASDMKDAHLQRLSAVYRKCDNALQELQKSSVALRSQLLLLEQRVAACEALEEKSDRQLHSLLSSMGELQMEAGNVRQLVGQLERKSLHPPSECPPPSETAVPRELSMLTNEEVVTLRLLIAQHHAANSNTIASSSRDSSVPSVVDELADLRERLGTVERRQQELQVQQSATATLAEPPSAGLAEAGVQVDLNDQLRLLRAVPYCDASGNDQIATPSVLVHGAPSFWGAGHLRELCEAKVGGVDTCLLVRVDAVQQKEKAAPVFLSQSSSSKIASTAHKDDNPAASKDSAKVTHFERVFEVTFRTTSQAIKAISTLNGMKLSASTRGVSAGGASSTLRVEPVVPEEVKEVLERLLCGGGSLSSAPSPPSKDDEPAAPSAAPKPKRRRRKTSE